MQWTMIRAWAKSYGYTSFREKTDREDNPNDYDYYWGKEDDPSVTGISNSVSKLATDIYNHMTDYEFVDYQNEYRESLKNKEIKYE